MEKQVELRKKIAEVKELNLPKAEEAKQIQALFYSKPKKEEIDQEKLIDEVSEFNEKAKNKIYQQPKNTILGCAHYQRKAKIIAKCCGKIFPCRLCHDDQIEDHKIDRYAIEKMLCMECNNEQLISQYCAFCQDIETGEKLKMAEYYCDICHLFSSDPSKNIFHCTGCNMCRAGKREDWTHCKGCDTCIFSGSFPNHKCQKGAFKSPCPACFEDMFSSVKPVSPLLCGHYMHQHCLEKFIQNNYQCPTCKKSVANMTGMWKRIETYVAATVMPEEYQGKTSYNVCNDCEKKSLAKYHFMYHKCEFCPSWNTNIVDQYDKEHENSIKFYEELEKKAKEAKENPPQEQPQSTDSLMQSLTEEIQTDLDSELESQMDDGIENLAEIPRIQPLIDAISNPSENANVELLHAFANVDLTFYQQLLTRLVSGDTITEEQITRAEQILNSIQISSQTETQSDSQNDQTNTENESNGGNN